MKKNIIFLILFIVINQAYGQTEISSKLNRLHIILDSSLVLYQTIHQKEFPSYKNQGQFFVSIIYFNPETDSLILHIDKVLFFSFNKPRFFNQYGIINTKKVFLNDNGFLFTDSRLRKIDECEALKTVMKDSLFVDQYLKHNSSVVFDFEGRKFWGAFIFYNKEQLILKQLPVKEILKRKWTKYLQNFML